MTAKHCTFIGMFIGMVVFLYSNKLSPQPTSGADTLGYAAGSAFVAAFYAIIGSGIGGVIGLVLFGKPDDVEDSNSNDELD